MHLNTYLIYSAKYFIFLVAIIYTKEQHYQPNLKQQQINNYKQQIITKKIENILAPITVA
jgi:hypothetical protein